MCREFFFAAWRNFGDKVEKVRRSGIRTVIVCGRLVPVAVRGWEMKAGKLVQCSADLDQFIFGGWKGKDIQKWERDCGIVRVSLWIHVNETYEYLFWKYLYNIFKFRDFFLERVRKFTIDFSEYSNVKKCSWKY